MKYQIAAVPSPMIDLVWDQLRPIFQRVVDLVPGELNVDDMYEEAALNKGLIISISLGPNIVGAAFVEMIDVNSTEKAFFVKALAGDDFHSWYKDLQLVFEALAKDFKCTQLRMAAARKGWIKELAPLGWKQSFIIMKKEV